MKNFKADFTLEVNTCQPKILQFTDTQIIFSNKQRYNGRIGDFSIRFWAPDKIYDRLLRYMETIINETKPDIIVITGDFVYGEFDDDGKVFKWFTDYMDSFKIPWTVCFGNHEKEAYIGIDFLCDVWEKSEFCFYKRVNYDGKGNKLEGDGTFSVALKHHDKDVAILNIMDSGSGTDMSPAGIFTHQIEWLENERDAEGVKLIFLHIPPICFYESMCKYGYDRKEFKKIIIGDNDSGDFGIAERQFGRNFFIDHDNKLFDKALSVGVTGMFAGHFHTLGTSILYKEMRLTMGCKTGEYDSFIPELMGGTLIKINNKNNLGFEVSHIVKKF